MPISSEALRKIKERSETKDTTVSLQRATPRTGDDIVQSLQKYKIYVDADVVIALFSPYRAQLEKFQGYNVLAMQDSFRNLEILANRSGEPNINLGLNFIGPCGTFRELPKASEITPEIEFQAKQLINNRSKFVRDENNIWIPNPNLIV